MAPIIAIVGPTAAGKSAVAIELAQRVDGEIINADSMQGYRGMDIGTAKVSAEDRRAVWHHVIDVWDPSDEISVVAFRDEARAAIIDVQQRQRIPIVVGGSWLYVQAIVDEIDFPPTDERVRQHWEERLRQVGPQALHDELRARDPASAAAILPGNGRRIVRALEVIDLTGSFTATLPEPTSWKDTLWWGIDVPRDHLDDRITQRVHDMWGNGFVDEVRVLREQGMGRTASKALGYSQILDFLDGRTTQEAAREATISATMKFARRQQRRFRRDDRITWWKQTDGDHPSSAIEEMAADVDQRMRT